MNRSIQTVIVAPMTTESRDYPTRVTVRFQQKQGWIVLDQIRTVDRMRLIKKLGKITISEQERVKDVLREMLID